MGQLSELPNIGKVLEEKLILAGIKTPEELRIAGTETVFMRLKITKNPDTCINMLYAIEGAIQGIRWHGLSRRRKNELKEFLHSLNL